MTNPSATSAGARGLPSSALPPGVLPGGRFATWRAPRSVGYVACDVDGTLVGTGTQATRGVVEAVGRATAAGIDVGLVTGRMRDAVASLRRQLAARGPHVLHNGAEVVTDGDELVADWTLDETQVDALLAIGRAHPDGVVEIYTRSGFVASSLDPRAEPHWEIIGAPPRAVVRSAAELSGEPVLKATFTAFSDETAVSVRAAVTAGGMNAGTATSPRTPQLSYVNATHPGADKGTALATVAGRLGLDLSEVIAVGDAGNDLPMLTVAGTAIAMGQAPARVVDASHLVVPAVNEDGVVRALDAARWWAGGR